MIKNRFKKILVPLDGSTNSIRGLNEAISLARQCNSEIIGIHVISRGPFFSAEKLQTLRNFQVRSAKKILKNAKIDAAKNGIDLQDEILYDNNTSDAISKFAKFKKCDIIIMGSRGKGHPKDDYFGSVAFGVLQKSKIPVLIIK